MNAGEKSSLLHVNVSRRSIFVLWFMKRYKHSFLPSKRIVVYLVWSGMIFTFTIILFLVPIQQYMAYMVLLLRLAFPLFGYIGEKYTRYYVIMASVVLTSVTALIVELLVLLFGWNFFIVNKTLGQVIYFFGGFLITLGLVIFEANYIQLGADQIQSVPSQDLASYARWSAFVFFLVSSLVITLDSTTLYMYMPTIPVYIIVAPFAILAFLSVLIGFFLKHFLIIQPPLNSDPLRLIVQVLRYAWKHKFPERPSSFTYTDGPPTRLDFGKMRYGGPFTTDEVEDVKSFWNVLAVVLSLTLVPYSSIGSNSYYISDNEFTNSNVSLSAPLEWVFFSLNSNYMVVLIIPILQLVIVPFFPCCIVSMLKRMWIGLTLKLISIVIAMMISYIAVLQKKFEYVLILANITGSTGTAVVMFSSLEFIFAQSPCRMQGILIGFWCMQFIVELIVFPVYVITVLFFLSFVIFSIVAYRYRYRTRNEPCDINIRANIEEVFERDLERARIMSQEEEFSISETVN